jgi:eukaryotic-like serine/threonine-protein kinase
MPSHASDRNLLFGILALQTNVISQDDLLAAMHVWVLNKDKPLDNILRERGVLPPDEHAALDVLVEKHLGRHGHDARKGLASLSWVRRLRHELHQFADPDVQASVAPVAAGQTPDDSDATIDEPHGTGAQAVGTPTSVGQRFRILRTHAKGGLGEVFVALDGELQREVALKEIQDRHADDPDSRARFLLDAEITGGLEHPGIVPVYGLGCDASGRPFYAMRFIKGDSLKDAITRFHEADVS